MSDRKIRVSRRDVLRGAGAAAVIGAVGKAHAQDAPPGITRAGPDAAKIQFQLNGKATELSVEPRVTLLDALRERLDLTGTKRVCDRGACGGCTVLVNGKIVNSCMMLAIDASGAKVTTVEGLAKDGKLHPVQEAFVKHDALMCGFCTPGFVVSCAAFVDSGVKSPTDKQIRGAIAGNICRCGTYTHIFDAVKEAAK